MIPYVLLSWVPSTKKTIDFELSEVLSIKNYPQSVAFFLPGSKWEKIGDPTEMHMKGSSVESWANDNLHSNYTQAWLHELKSWVSLFHKNSIFPIIAYRVKQRQRYFKWTENFTLQVFKYYCVWSLQHPWTISPILQISKQRFQNLHRQSYMMRACYSSE